MATIKDVSAYTGLALGTISKYLNGGYVRPENKMLLDQAVQALDYRVNQAARNLKQNCKRRIGVMVPTEATSQYSEMLSFIEEELQAQGYSCMMVHFFRESASICQKVSMLSGIVDGIILISCNVSAEDLQKTCGDLPLILIDHGSPCDVFDTFLVDYRKIASDVVEQFLVKKQSRFGLIKDKAQAGATYNLYASYRQAILNNQLNIEPEQILECEDSFQAGFNANIQLVRQNDPPTTILVTSSQLTLGVLASARLFEVLSEPSSNYVGFSANHVI